MKSFLKLLFAAAFFNSVSWIILIPVWQYPDEQAHFAQIQDLAEIGHIPVGSKNDTSQEIALSEKILDTNRDQLGNNKFTYHPQYRIKYSSGLYGPDEKTILDLPKETRKNLVKKEATLNPPLYYLASAQVYKIFSDGNLFTRVFAIRFLSMVLFLLIIILSFKIGQLIFEKNKILPLALASFIAFKPMLIFASTGVLPDSLTNSLFSFVLLVSLKILRFGIKSSYLATIALLITLGVSTRQQFLISLLVIAFPIFYQIIKNQKHLKKFIIAVFALILFLLFSNTIGTTIPLVGNFRIPETSQFNITLIFSLQFIQYLIQFTKHFLAETWPWYWGVYKWLSLTVPHINYQIINRIVLIAIIGLLLKIIIAIKNRSPRLSGRDSLFLTQDSIDLWHKCLSFFTRNKFTKPDLVLLYLIWGSLIYFLVFAAWNFIFMKSSGFSFGFQGRYYFPLVIFHLAILLIGLTQIFAVIFKKYFKFLVLMLIALMIAFNDLSLAYIASSYYDVSSYTKFIIEASQYKPIIFKGNIILAVVLASLVLQAVFIFKFAKFLKSRKPYIIDLTK